MKRGFHILINKNSGERYGPHNEEILSIIFGSLLGNAHAELRGNKTRIRFNKSSNNMEYINWLHNKLYTQGYCSEKDLTNKLANKMIKFNTFSYGSFNFLHNIFYDREVYPLGRKRLKREYVEDLISLFTPLAFAVWFMDDGSYFRDQRLWLREGLTITPSVGFDYESQIDIIREIITYKYGIKTTYVYRLYKTKELIMFPVEEIPKLNALLDPYVLPSLKYKLRLPDNNKKPKRRSLLFDDIEKVGDMGVNG